MWHCAILHQQPLTMLAKYDPTDLRRPFLGPPSNPFLLYPTPLAGTTKTGTP